MKEMPTHRQPLLILDLDECLFYAAESRLLAAETTIVDGFFVYVRPYLAEFMHSVRKAYELAIWSSATADYVQELVSAVFEPAIEWKFIWSRDRCVESLDETSGDMIYLKDLKKVTRTGFSISRILILEDDARKVQRNYGNAIYVTPYYGNPDDNQLRKLESF